MPHVAIGGDWRGESSQCPTVLGMAAPDQATKRPRRTRGTGSVNERRNGFEAAIQVDGRRKTKLFKTYNEAEAWLNDLVRARAAASRPKESNQLTYWIEQRLATKAGILLESRKKARSECALLRQVMGHLPVTAITAEHITTMWQVLSPSPPSTGAANTALAERGARSRDPEWDAISRRAKSLGLKPATAGRPELDLASGSALMKTFRHLKGALDLAKRNGVVRTNVADDDRLQPSSERTNEAAQAWTPDEVRHLLHASEGHNYFSVFFFALSTGIRIGEAQALQWREVSLERNEIAILQTGNRGARNKRKTKTTSSYRIVPFDNECRELLLRLRTEQVLNRRVRGERYQDHGLVFAGPLGGAFVPKRVNDALEIWCNATGAEPLTFHATRHTYVSMARRAGIKIEVISKRLGHASVEYTQQRYRHIYPDEGSDEVLSINEMLQRGSRSFYRPTESAGPDINVTDLTDRLTQNLVEELDKRHLDDSIRSKVLDAIIPAVARTMSHLMQPEAESATTRSDTALKLASNSGDLEPSQHRTEDSRPGRNGHHEDSALRRVA